MTAKQSYEAFAREHFIKTERWPSAATPFTIKAMEQYARKDYIPWMTMSEYSHVAKNGDVVDVWDGSRRLTHIWVQVNQNVIGFKSPAGVPIGKVTHVMYPPKPPTP